MIMLHHFKISENNLPTFITSENQSLTFKQVRKWIELLSYQAGQMLLNEFHAPNGPRGSYDKADIDKEIEAFLKRSISQKFPTHGIYAEEEPSTNQIPQSKNDYVWHIDPNDGTKAYLKMHRGSSLSIALSYQDEPIFGIVYAYSFPNDQGDFISGGHPSFGSLKRNDKVWHRVDFPQSLQNSVIAISQSSDQCSLTNSELCAPARCISIPSIAYRLALIAVGDVDVGVSLASPGRLDCWAGLALLKSLGASIISTQGIEVDFVHTYGDQLIIGGPIHLTSLLAQRNWDRVFHEINENKPTLYDLTYPQLKKTLPIDTSGILARAQGVLLGQCAGDALGSLVEFQSPESIKNTYPNGVSTMHDGGTFNTIAGQATDDTEMALTLARALVKHGIYHEGIAAMGYADWLNSHPFDLGNTTATALRPVVHIFKSQTKSIQNWTEEEWKLCALQATDHASTSSQANGALMRISPLAVFTAGTELTSNEIADLARTDACLTHPHLVCQDTNAVYTVAIAEGIRHQHTKESLYNYVIQWAQENHICSEVMTSLNNATSEYLPMYPKQIGWVLRAFQGAFYMLLHSSSLADGIQSIVEMGGDTDTNAAITGALLGCIYGINGIPQDWMRMVCSNRPMFHLAGVYRPRPRSYWTCDVLRLSEQLLCAKKYSL
jgi:ADP-ribosyl-[dinitrogen reductase] hydrolase